MKEECQACGDGIGRVHDEIDSYIEKGIWGVIGVFHENPEKNFSYSIGMRHYGKPEIIVCGLPLETSKIVINNANRTAKDGNVVYQDGQFDNNILDGFPVAYVDVSEKNKRKYLVQAYSHYESWAFPAVQMVWPDTNGKFPWDEEYEEKFKYQPVLKEL